MSVSRRRTSFRSGFSGEVDDDDDVSVGSGIGSVDADAQDFPLTFNSVVRREGPFRPLPDDFLGLPALYIVKAGEAVARTSVIHYLDPLLLELPRVTTVLPKREAEEHNTFIAVLPKVW